MISRLFSSCWFGHGSDPHRVIKGKTLHFQCEHCMADLGPVLKGQKFKARKVKVPKRPADVLRIRKVV